ncbi:MAG: DMT family transporter [Litoreibacter sp.]|nr:DMT family transporter [Litoreibacter sp.]
MTGDRPVLGILFMLGFCVLAPLGDALAKLLGETIPLGQLLLTRFGIQAALLVPLALLTARALRMSGRVLRLTLLRTALHIVGIGAMFTSLRFLPLADAIAIAFVMPFIMLLLGRYVLGEEIGARRLGACCVGFLGTLLVIQPSFAAVGPPALLPLLVAVVFALFMLVTRQVAKEVDPVSLQAVSGVFATIFLGAVVLLPAGPTLPMLDLVLPAGMEWVLLMAIGGIGTGAHLLMTWSLRYAPSATLAPMQYLEIPVATVIGYLVFRDWPNDLAMLGIAITVGAGLYIVYREQQNARLIPPET